MVLWMLSCCWAVLLLPSARAIRSLKSPESVQETVSLYKLEGKNLLVSWEYHFELALCTSGASEVLFAQLFPLSFLHLALQTNYSTFDLHLVQGRWQEQLRPYFPKALDEGQRQRSLKRALGFSTFDAGLTFQAAHNSQLNRIVEFVGGFLCAGTNRLVKNLVTASRDNQELFDYASDPMNYLCYDNLVHWLELMQGNDPKKRVSRLFDKLSFSRSLYTQLDVEQKRESEKLLLDFRLVFMIGEEDLRLRELAIAPSYPGFDSKVASTQVRLCYDRWNHCKIQTLLNTSALHAFTELLDTQKGVEPYYEPLSIHRHIGGMNNELHSKYIAIIQSTTKQKVLVRFQEYLPHFLRPYFSTLQVWRNEVLLSPQRQYSPYKVSYNSKGDCHLDLGILEVEANETYRIVMQVEKLMLPFEEYPHDSARGMDLPQTLFAYRLANESTWVQTSVNAIVVRLPEPDFSMPFNVHSLYCVLVGLMFKIYLNICKELP